MLKIYLCILGKQPVLVWINSAQLMQPYFPFAVALPGWQVHQDQIQQLRGTHLEVVPVGRELGVVERPELGQVRVLGTEDAAVVVETHRLVVQKPVLRRRSLRRKKGELTSVSTFSTYLPLTSNTNPKSLSYNCLGSGCSTAVEHRPAEQNS